MSPDTPVTKAELERRVNEAMTAVLREHREANQHQDEAWNMGFRAIREDFNGLVTRELSQLHLLLEAKLDPIRKVAYGTVGLLVAVLVVLVAYVVGQK